MVLFDLVDDFFNTELNFWKRFDDMFKEFDELREGEGKNN